MKFHPSATTKLGSVVGIASIVGGAYNHAVSPSAPWAMSTAPMLLGGFILVACGLLGLIEWRASRPPTQTS